MDLNNNNEELAKQSAPNLENEKNECLAEINKEFNIKNVAFQTVCILSLIWHGIILVVVGKGWYSVVYKYFLNKRTNQNIIDNDYEPYIVTLGIVIYAVMIYSTLLSTFGTFKIKKGIPGGFAYFFQGNSIFLISLVIAILGNNEYIGYYIIYFIISGLFRLQFKDYKQIMLSNK
jgi:hypothetical protein